MATTAATSGWLSIGNLSNSSLLDSNQTNESCVYNFGVSNYLPVVNDFSVGYKVFVGLLYTTLAVFGITGNVFILVILGRDWRHKMENTANVCLLNVIAIDLFYYFFCHPLILWNLFREGTWSTKDITCQLNGGLNCMAYLIGGYSLSLTSLERTLNLKYPAKPRVLTKYRAKIFIGFLWTFSFACAILPIFGVNEYVVYRNPLFCGPSLNYTTWQVIIMTTGLLGTFFIVFVSQGILVYWVIGYKKQRREDQAMLETRLRRRQAGGTGDTSTLSVPMATNSSEADIIETNASKIQIHWEAFKDNIRTALTVAIICSTYILGFVFGAGMGTALTLSYRKELASCAVFVDLNLYLWTVEAAIYMTCFAVNPYVYGLRNNDITKEFRSMFARLNPISSIRSTLRRRHAWDSTQDQSHGRSGTNSGMPVATF